ncbi:ribosomal RNA small subunit methyltransferase A [Candidatus Gracilibacteria bacterium]|nr:MAG: ribosomal RNA small subunit methyltransferase A [Candidatus Gracilibacteria bacterium]
MRSIGSTKGLKNLTKFFEIIKNMIEDIFKKFKIKAKKSLGQNFLVDDSILKYIADYLDLENKNIVEVGPGYGALTQKLLDNSPKSLTLVELDKDMVSILEKRIEDGDLNAGNVNFKINNVDVLKYFPLIKNYSVIANIPYYITSPILRHFLYEVENKPANMIILMQKDVGDKILLGQDNNKRYTSSVLSLFVAKKTKVIEIASVPKESFIPSPKIESSVLFFEKHNLYDDIPDKKFLKIIKIGFLSPRKKLIKNLNKGGFNKSELLKIFSELGMDENIRGEILGINDWCNLIKKL